MAPTDDSSHEPAAKPGVRLDRHPTEPPPASPLRLVGLPRMLANLAAVAVVGGLIVFGADLLVERRFGLVAGRIVGLTLAFICLVVIAVGISKTIRGPQQGR